jgi:hypothetical protein
MVACKAVIRYSWAAEVIQNIVKQLSEEICLYIQRANCVGTILLMRNIRHP